MVSCRKIMGQRSAKSSPACAACKHQRRKCLPNCPLAPYFPAHLHKHFLNAHRLFGVSNIVKMTTDLQPHQKDIAMTSIIHQANVRAIDPVGGCYKIICDLQRRIDFATAELEMVRTQIALSKTQLPRLMSPADETVSTLQALTSDVDDHDFKMYATGLAPVPTVEYQQQGIYFQDQLGEQKQKGFVRKSGDCSSSENVCKAFDRRSVKVESDECPSFSSQLRGERGLGDVSGDVNQIVGGFS